jgi:hypothetical protein
MTSSEVPSRMVDTAVPPASLSLESAWAASRMTVVVDDGR